MNLNDMTFESTPRGVIRLETCDVCRRTVPVMGAPGKGRPLETFPGGDFFCQGHAMRVPANPFTTNNA